MKSVKFILLSVVIGYSSLATGPAHSLNYYVDGSMMYVLTFQTSQGRTLYTGCGPTQCLQLNKASMDEVIELINGSTSKYPEGTWEYAGQYGRCHVWIHPEEQGSYPSLARVKQRLEEDC